MAYRSYPAVASVQEWLETAKEAGSFDFAGSLKEADGTYDGKWGPDTNGVFTKWLTTQPSGSNIWTMVEYDLITADEAREVERAIREYRAGGIAEEEKEESEYRPNVPAKKAGIGIWLVGGVVAGTVIYLLVRKYKKG